MAAAAALAYGCTIVFGRLLARAGFGEATALGFRFGIAGVVLLAIQAVRRGPMLPVPGERWRVLGLGGVGYAVESTFFYFGLQRGSAAAVAFIFYSYPAMVTALEVALGAQRFTAPLAGALALTVGGTAAVVLAGGDVSISAAGVAFSLLSAASFAVYATAGARIVPRSHPMTKAAWVALGCATSQLARGLLDGSLEAPGRWWPQVLGTGLATAAAFALMFVALGLIGATRTSVVMTMEAVAAVILAAIFLDEPVRIAQAAGGLAVLTGAVLVARAPRPRPAVVTVPAEPPALAPPP